MNTTPRSVSALQTAHELSTLSPRAIVLLERIREASARGGSYPDNAADAGTLEELLASLCSTLIEVTEDGTGWRALPVE